jgi:hypothetical protein
MQHRSVDENVNPPFKQRLRVGGGGPGSSTRGAQVDYSQVDMLDVLYNSVNVVQICPLWNRSHQIGSMK